ncbi:nucleotidyltransferase family protein [Micromonospora globispora]|uniref:nucleotidyltransferase family protein n=1 Tax=Micromonospora globispora TaxID=1450148 RepID=UPI00311AB1A6
MGRSGSSSRSGVGTAVRGRLRPAGRSGRRRRILRPNRDPAATLQVCAPFGLDDLLNGIWRRNPRRVTVELSRARLARHEPSRRWPRVKIIPP